MTPTNRPHCRECASTRRGTAILTAVLALLLLQATDHAGDRTQTVLPQQTAAASSRRFVGIELGADILSSLLEWKSINDWSQPEIDAYYEVLDFARKTPFREQKAQARKNLRAELQRYRGIIRERYKGRRRKQLLKQVRKYEDKPSSYPLFTQLMVSLLNENKPRRVRAATSAVVGVQASGPWSMLPSRFQGKLVTLKGQIRKLVSYRAHKNKFGITTLYEAWLFTDDSGALAAKPVGKKRPEDEGKRPQETLGKIPLVVIFTQKPAGMPQGDKILEAATITGYVFRMHQYEDKRNTEFLALAPLLLAQKVEWHPRKKSKPTSAWIYAAVVASLVAGVLTIVWATVRDAKRRRKRRAAMTDAETIRLPVSEE
ncbi:MAG: hypothetical protein IID45_02890 [Planctomycetes bacterium]|nr:hypothetical protein [Planctomycetota bacterium]